MVESIAHLSHRLCPPVFLSPSRTRRNSELRVPPHLQQGEPCMSPIPRTTGGKDSNPLRDQALTSSNQPTHGVRHREGRRAREKWLFHRGKSLFFSGGTFQRDSGQCMRRDVVPALSGALEVRMCCNSCFCLAP